MNIGAENHSARPVLKGCLYEVNVIFCSSALIQIIVGIQGPPVDRRCYLYILKYFHSNIFGNINNICTKHCPLMFAYLLSHPLWL